MVVDGVVAAVVVVVDDDEEELTLDSIINLKHRSGKNS